MRIIGSISGVPFEGTLTEEYNCLDKVPGFISNIMPAYHEHRIHGFLNGPIPYENAAYDLNFSIPGNSGHCAGQILIEYIMQRNGVLAPYFYEFKGKVLTMNYYENNPLPIMAPSDISFTDVPSINTPVNSRAYLPASSMPTINKPDVAPELVRVGEVTREISL